MTFKAVKEMYDGGLEYASLRGRASAESLAGAWNLHLVASPAGWVSKEKILSSAQALTQSNYFMGTRVSRLVFASEEADNGFAKAKTHKVKQDSLNAHVHPGGSYHSWELTSSLDVNDPLRFKFESDDKVDYRFEYKCRLIEDKERPLEKMICAMRLTQYNGPFVTTDFDGYLGFFKAKP